MTKSLEKPILGFSSVEKRSFLSIFDCYTLQTHKSKPNQSKSLEANHTAQSCKLRFNHALRSPHASLPETLETKF
jgi:hypothetical protein